MPYLGSAPATSFLSMTSQSFTGGSGTSFTLNKAVSTTSDIAAVSYTHLTLPTKRIV